MVVVVNLMMMSCILRRRFSQTAIQRAHPNLNLKRPEPTVPDYDEEGFRVLQLRPGSKKMPSRQPSRSRRQSSRLDTVDDSRTDRMNLKDLDWPSIWPGPRTFHPHSIPLPVRQGQLKRAPLLNKYVNPELMKIPNFFHLTPPAVKKHCEALKKFCSPFPKDLNTRQKCDDYFPITVSTNDYLHSSPTIRDPAARVVSVKLQLKFLPLDEHARDKLLRLVGHRYDPKRQTLTIVTDRCPLRKQNYEYAQYLLTALFYESWKKEAWESEKSEQDMEKYVWEKSASAKNLASILHWTPGKEEVKPLKDLSPVHVQYKKKVSTIMEVESERSIADYGKTTKELLLKASNSVESESSIADHGKTTKELLLKASNSKENM